VAALRREVHPKGKLEAENLHLALAGRLDSVRLSRASRKRPRRALPWDKRGRSFRRECSRNHTRGPEQIPRGHFLDKCGHVDTRGASDGAGRVETVETARRLNGRLANGHCRIAVGELSLVLFGSKFRGCFVKVACQH
jgi:hypothetical protein